ncbi:MAG: hypothetical protein H6568_06985 [Lewinellaceae bacterium]|nr:hypothetical protein [Lewinellaceae bacterium]
MKYQIIDDRLWDIANAEFGESGGVYIIIGINDGKPIPVNRLLGVDVQGILYIGKANSFLDRVINLKKSVSPKYKGTSPEFGVRYKKHKRIQELYPPDSLYLELISTGNSEIEERKLLDEYYQAFGELPPMNRRM